jgi:hypothetical protein
VAERCYRLLEEAEAAVAAGDVATLGEVLEEVPSLPASAPPALRDAIAAMLVVLDEARRDPVAVCGAGAEAWSAASGAARHRVVRMSLELRMVVSISA